MKGHEKEGRMMEKEYQIRLKRKKVYFFIKRILDIILSAIGLIFLSPFFLLIAIFIKLDDSGPVFYLHKRIGQYGKDLYIYKFRSMTTKYETFNEFYETLDDIQKEEWDDHYKLENDPRITKVGAFLRRTSLDELPQMLNIFLGNMSIIGPRPVVDDEIEKYGDQKDKFLAVKPGLTGYWAANGRSTTTYEERVEMELYYVDHCSLWLDFKLFFKTFLVVLKKDGAM